MASPWDDHKAQVAQAARELAQLGLTGRASGNMSVRLPGAELLIAITPTRYPLKSLEPRHICVADAEGNHVDGELAPSSELPLHLSLYKAQCNVDAVVHSHSIYASVCAVAGLEIPPLLDELIVLVGGAIRVSEYARPGTADLGAMACAALEERKAALLRNHGLVTVGHDIEEALDLTQLVERAAQIFVLSRFLGRARLLPPEVVAAEQQLYREQRQREAGKKKPPAKE